MTSMEALLEARIRETRARGNTTVPLTLLQVMMIRRMLQTARREHDELVAQRALLNDAAARLERVHASVDAAANRCRALAAAADSGLASAALAGPLDAVLDDLGETR